MTPYYYKVQQIIDGTSGEVISQEVLDSVKVPIEQDDIVLFSGDIVRLVFLTPDEYINTLQEIYCSVDTLSMNQSSNNRLKNHVMFSGLAKGGDNTFMNLSAKYGVGRQIHIRPVGNLGNTNNLPNGVEVLVAQSEHLFKAVDKIKELLGIELRLGMGSNLLARNYYQVNKSESVLAVAYLTGDFKSVSGGTRMAVDLGVALKLPVYVLDVTSEAWYSYNYEANQFQLYSGIPPLTRKFTGVGTRDIELFNVPCKLTGNWIPSEFVGQDKANRLIALMEQVFIQATNN